MLVLLHSPLTTLLAIYCNDENMISYHHIHVCANKLNQINYYNDNIFLQVPCKVHGAIKKIHIRMLKSDKNI